MRDRASLRIAIERARFWLAVAERIGGTMEEEKQGRLVSDWKSVLLKSWSIRLAVLAPIALEAIWYILTSAPPEIREYIRLPVFVLFAVLAGLARIWNQQR